MAEKTEKAVSAAEPLIKVDTEKEIRCPECNRLLQKGVVVSIEMKCPKCKAVIRFKNMAIR